MPEHLTDEEILGALDRVPHELPHWCSHPAGNGPDRFHAPWNLRALTQRAGSAGIDSGAMSIDHENLFGVDMPIGFGQC
jgi:hypothetical protein